MSQSSSEVIEGRLHPLTPLRKSWAAAFAMYFMIQNLVELFDDELRSLHPPFWVMPAIYTVLGLTCLIPYVLSWRRSHYRLDGEALEYQYGLIWRAHERYELKHVQTVDVSRPLIGRLIGACSLKVSLAASSASLSYLSLAQARALKARILHTEDDSEYLHKVPTKMLWVSLFTDVRTMIYSVIGLVFGIWPYLQTEHLLSLATLIPVLRYAWSATGSKMANWHGWSVCRTPEGNYRMEHGAFNTSQYTWQRDRVQSVELYQPIMWRRWDWVRIYVSVSGARSPGILLPVCTRAVAEKMIAHLLGPDAVTCMSTHVPAPPQARRRTLFHKALGYHIHSGFFACWNGLFLRQTVTVCPLALVEESQTVQGPWQRALGLASVSAELSGGEDVTARHVHVADAPDIEKLIRTRQSESPLPVPRQWDPKEVSTTSDT